ncbi:MULTISPECIES: hypothetical protein [Aerococcus]|uniref:Uncharacterized protein n=1 Tax=Aerococcus sanguinicola TaxID=119206 RepID=A0A5N1GKI5_9LACT|nr:MULTISPECIES: hypothetical protein [Aerococcus]KAA9300924.1 hypothetical protein F6I03_06355 [Aerococcus sanguinicola]MDK6369157.1 hypothetical protein [Aerococcus sp. UMB9870]MDK6679783.1 hypothetical protein [Aerococcus sp. UMB8608]MDK6686650.1 hypothetical protein [Aerococcus sp. UMB8623]MDK6939705.1 hypothetical protein [Aerococcus sp. UMB8487]
MNEILVKVVKSCLDLPANSTYQVLVGKRTPSTLYFALKHQLAAYFGLFPQLKKADWGQVLAGQSAYQDYSNTKPAFLADLLDFRQGMVFPPSRQKRYEAYLLLVQALSQLAYKQSRYVTVTQDWEVQQFVKLYLSKLSPLDRETVLEAFYHEWGKMLDSWPQDQADFLVSQFSGHDAPALAAEDCLDLVHGREFDLARRYVLGRLDQSLQDSATLPYLTYFKRGLDRRFPAWKPSADVTLQALLQGASLKELQDKRGLKASTLYDHLIEVAVFDCELLLPYLSQALGRSPASFYAEPAPEDYAAFQDQYEGQAFWLYRVWQIANLKGKGAVSDRA